MRLHETKQLQWAIFVRLAVVAAIFVASLALPAEQQDLLPRGPVQLFALGGFLISLLHILLTRYWSRVIPLGFIQIAGDVILETYLVSATGGVESPFSFFYLATILTGGILLFRQGTVAAALFATIAYSIVVLGGHGGLLPQTFRDTLKIDRMPFSDYINGFSLNLLGFLTVALLMGYLAERLRATGTALEERTDDLATLRALSDSIIDHMSSGMATVNLEGKITSWNNAARSITGYEPAAVLGQSLFGLIDSPESDLASIRQDLAKRRVHRFEAQFQVSGGRKIPVGISATRLLNAAGNWTGFILLFQDLTDLRQLEREVRVKEKMAAIGEMASALAHEIRNPLASLSGSIQVMKAGDLEENEQTKLMDIVLTESDRLNKVLESFLGYARPNQFEPRPLDVHATIEEVVTLLRHRDDVRGKHRIRYEGVPGILINADENLVKQLFWNLATNALKANPRDGFLEIKVRPIDDERVELTFRDNGVGMSEKEIESIFQPFKGSFSTGAGLGMSVVYGIVQNHGGTIRVESAPNRGTTVRVRFPRLMASESEIHV